MGASVIVFCVFLLMIGDSVHGNVVGYDQLISEKLKEVYKDMADIRHQLHDQLVMNTQLKNDNLQQQEEIKRLKEQVEIVSKRQGNVDEPVGFTAYAEENAYFDEGSTVVFDQVVTNFGDFYKPDTSTFICPYHGVYVFSVNFMAPEGASMHIRLEKEGEHLVDAWADNDASEYNHAGAMVVTDCNLGQLVYAKCTYGGTLYGSQRRSHFTGFLLYQYS